jgi:hypothetical protein
MVDGADLVTHPQSLPDLARYPYGYYSAHMDTIRRTEIEKYARDYSEDELVEMVNRAATIGYRNNHKLFKAALNHKRGSTS